MKNYKYKAFISYRHLEPDMQAAEKLQKLLESYKPPKNFTDKKENWRIFRDVSELQSSSDLSEDIRNAIEDSEFLIVICSPAYNESKWCMQELTRFRELHGDTNENIITLLVAGEPDKAFPELLRYTEMKTVDENGNESTVKVEVEPLAANIKADTLKESMKKLNTEYLRIAAPLIGCDFNDLYQREKKREAQRRMRIVGSAFAVLSVITAVSAGSAIAISKKNSEIKDKNNKINEQYDQIEEQYAEIEKQYGELLIENAGHLAAESEVLYKNSSLIPAIKKAVKALPSKEGEKPVIPEAESVLSRELDLFEPDSIIPRYSLRHESTIEKLSFMGGGSSVVSQDTSGIYFWSAEDGSLIKKITPADAPFASEKYGSSNKLTAIIEADDNKTGTVLSYTGTPGTYSYMTGNIFDAIYPNYCHNVTDDEPGTGGDVYISNSDGTIWRLNGADGEIKWSTPMQENAYSCMAIQSDGKHLLRIFNDRTQIAGGNYVSGKNVFMDIIDCETGEISDYADITGLAGVTLTFLTEVEIETVRDNILYTYSGGLLGDEKGCKLRAYEIKDHKLVKKEETEIPENSRSAIRKVDLRFIENDPVASVSDVSADGYITSIIRYDKKLDKQLWTAGLNTGSKEKSRMFLFKAEDIGGENDILAVVCGKSFSIVNYSDGKVIKTVELDSSIADVSFSEWGLIMFTVRDGGEYAVNVKSYIGENPKNNAYLLESFGAPFDLCSYSRGKYVTAGEFANTAYIQFRKATPSYTGIKTEEKYFCRSVSAVDSEGKTALVSMKEYPEGSTTGIDHTYLYSADDGSTDEISALSGYTVYEAEFIENGKIAAAVGKGSEKKIVFINTSDGSVTDIPGTDNFDTNIVRFTPGCGGICYANYGKTDIIRIMPDGSVDSWGTDSKSVKNGLYCISGSKAAIYATYPGDHHKLEFYSYDDGSFVTADYDFDAADGVTVNRVFSINDSKAGVLLSSRIVLVFDTGTGELTSEVKLTSLSQEPISAVGLGNGRFAVLCRDAKLYESDIYGVTGNVISLEYSNGYNGPGISESDNFSTDYLESLPSNDGKYRYIVWNNAQAWLINTDEFKERYRICNFACAPSGKDIVFTCDDKSGKAGFFPVYTAQQLISTARDYLEDLGENAEEAR